MEKDVDRVRVGGGRESTLRSARVPLEAIARELIARRRNEYVGEFHEADLAREVGDALGSA